MSTEPKCGKQRTYRKPKSFRCNTYKKHGGEGWLLLTRNPRKDFYPAGASRAAGLFHESPVTRSYLALLTSSAQFSLQGIDKGRLAVFSGRAGGTMAEVGLLPFARVALQVATQVLPPYRTRFSKHQFTQPQLLAVLCLMRYEDWTFREAEVRLREHHELRAALHLP